MDVNPYQSPKSEEPPPSIEKTPSEGIGRRGCGCSFVEMISLIMLLAMAMMLGGPYLGLSGDDYNLCLFGGMWLGVFAMIAVLAKLVWKAVNRKR